ncbi:MAG: helix-turn-helix transcriptional regulator [Clostridia bacterium]|nr:helix-turn-helix transcriptional regulator [Clostridia bacterium]
MYKNKAVDGSNNICGQKVKRYRESLTNRPSQKAFSDMLQIEGLDVDKNAVQRIESGKRFVTDIELKIIAKVLHVSYEDLLDVEGE